MKPSSVPSSRSITKARKRAAKSKTKSDTIRMTLTFSMALAPFQMAAIVMMTAIAWKKTTSSGFCRNEFHTSTVSTSAVRPPRMAAWK